MSEPSRPGSEEARLAMERFRAGQCQHIYMGHGARRGRCTDRAILPKEQPRWCKNHVPSNRPRAVSIKDIPIWQGEE